MAPWLLPLPAHGYHLVLGAGAGLGPQVLDPVEERGWGGCERRGRAVRGHFCNPGEGERCLLFHLGLFALALS